jgi:hypothetical protein
LRHFAAAIELPAWDAAISAVNEIVNAAAIVIGGVFAYLRVLRGRVIHSNLALSLECKLAKVADKPAMQITASWLNSGTFRMIFPVTCSAMVTVCHRSHSVFISDRDRGDPLERRKAARA